MADAGYMTPYLRSVNVGYETLDRPTCRDEPRPVVRKEFGLQYGDVAVSEGSASANAKVGMSASRRDVQPALVCTEMTFLRLRALEGVCMPGFVFHWSMWAYESRAFLYFAGGTTSSTSAPSGQRAWPATTVARPPARGGDGT